MTILRVQLVRTAILTNFLSPVWSVTPPVGLFYSLASDVVLGRTTKWAFIESSLYLGIGTKATVTYDLVSLVIY